MKKLIFTFLIVVFTLHTEHALGEESSIQGNLRPTTIIQGSQKNGPKIQPDKQIAPPIAWPNYGSLLVDWGFNFLRDCPQELQNRAFNARTSTLYGYYNIRLGKSHFVISPGIGVRSEGYQFSKQDEDTGYNTLVRDDERHTAFQSARKVLHNATEKVNILQSSLAASYWDLLLEFRFNANKKYPKEGFFAAIGGEINMLWDSFTKIIHRDDEQTKQGIIKDSFNLNQIRYGVHGRLGWGRFSVFYKHMLSSLFNEEKGPKKTTTKPVTVGLSIDLF